MTSKMNKRIIENTPITHFYGIVDLLSILPTYLALIITSTQYLMIIRIFRLMRVFRILKIARFMNEADTLWNYLKASRAKIGVFLFAVFNVAVIMGTIMYIVKEVKMAIQVFQEVFTGQLSQ